MRKYLMITAGLLTLLVGLVAVSVGSGGAQAPTVQQFTIAMGEGQVITEAEGELGETEDKLTGEFHRWEPDVLVVHKGDVVKLTVKNPRSTRHSFELKDFGVITPDLDPRGGEAAVEFVADKAGSFTYICATEPKEGAYCALDHRRQTGTLLVLER